MRPVPLTTVAAVLDHALAQPPGLGAGRLVCIDGPAGSGKSTLGAAVAAGAAGRGAGSVHVLHTDDLLDGWAGLPVLGERLLGHVVAPLAVGRPARYRRYDWLAAAPAEEHLVAPMDLLVLEGVGAADPRLAAHRATLVWVEATDDVRLARGLARDGEELREQWLSWMRDEAVLFRRHRTRELADLRVDDVGRLAPARPRTS